MRSTVAAPPAKAGRGDVAPGIQGDQSLLEQPGILASMLSPSAEDHDVDRMPHGSEAAWPGSPRLGGAFLWFGAAVGACLSDIAVRLRELHGLSTFSRRDWWCVAIVVAATALCVRGLAQKASARPWVVVGAAALGVAVSLQRFFAAHESLAAIGGQAVLFGGLLGLLSPIRVRWDGALALVAAVAVAGVLGASRFDDDPSLVTGLTAIAAMSIALPWLACLAPPCSFVRRSGWRAWVMPIASAATLVFVVAAMPSTAGLADHAATATATYAGLLALTLCSLAGRNLGIAIGATVAGMLLGQGLPSSASPTSLGAVCEVGTVGTAVGVYVRPTQEMQLYENGELIDACGPDRGEAPLTAVLLQALLQAGDRVQFLGAGIGRTVALLARLEAHTIEVVDTRPQVDGLRSRLLVDGPVAPVLDASAPPLGRHAYVGGLLATLRALPSASRQALVLPEPLAGHSREQVMDEVQRELRRVVGGGIVVQVVALDRTPPTMLARLFASAARVNPWNGLFAVGNAAVLVSGGTPPLWSAVVPSASWSDEARWLLHLAHLGDVDDLQRALIGVLRVPTAASDAGGSAAEVGRRQALAVVRAWCAPTAAPEPALAGSLLQRWTALRAEMLAVQSRLAELADDPAGRAEAQAAAMRFLPFGAPSAALQAALGLPAIDGQTLNNPDVACLRAHAIDPTFFLAASPVFRSLPVPRQARSALEDLARLPPRPRLAEACVGMSPLAVALRARFPTPCARALIEQLALAPLSIEAAQALRELTDPFVLAEAARVLAARGAVRELLGLWRGDLPMPVALASLLRGMPGDREALVLALRGRRDPSCHPVLAELLVAPESAIRRQAAEILRQAVGDRIEYDPDWPLAARIEAAERLRALHNRAP